MAAVIYKTTPPTPDCVQCEQCAHKQAEPHPDLVTCNVRHDYQWSRLWRSCPDYRPLTSVATTEGKPVP